MSFDQFVKDRILDFLAMDSTGMPMDASGIFVPEDVKPGLPKAISEAEVNLEFIPETI